MRTAILFFLSSYVLCAQTTIASSVGANADSSALHQQIEMMRKSLRDYGNLARYHEEDRRLSASSQESSVVFMGDSITDFWGRQHGQFFPRKNYVNRGIGGQVTPQMLLRFYQDVIELKPKVVVILAGTNDIGGSAGPISSEATESNLKAMVELARAHNIAVVLSSLTPVCLLYSAPNTKTAPGENHRTESVDQELRSRKQAGVSGLLSGDARRKGQASQGTYLRRAASERQGI